MKAPSFWQNRGLISTALLPLSALYWGIGKCRTLVTKSYHADSPVICVGNITSGGTGKTPVTRYLAEMLQEKGFRPVILSRGYGGNLTGPVLVTSNHSASNVGDEPLLLAQSCDVVIAKDRAAGARYITQKLDCDVIIMDDGMQNPTLHKDMILSVFDGAIGLQNGRLLPAGPLRTSFTAGLAQTDIILINGTDTHHLTDLAGGKAIMSFSLMPAKQKKSQKPALAFAGIGNPQRFFNSAKQAGYQLTDEIAFGDHHFYDEAELQGLAKQAQSQDAILLTTEKDWMRLPDDWRQKVTFLPVTFQLSSNDEQRLQALITAKL